MSSEILHYKRGMYYINKLIETFPNGEYVQKNEDDFFEKQHHRFKCNEIASFDLNNFNFLCTLALMGLNKESIERSGNNQDYKYKIDYSYADPRINSNIIKEYLVILKNYLSRFDDTRKYNSEYDEWLSINNLNHLPNYDYNYLSKVRNSFMHSEYNFDLFLGRVPLLANIKNTDYTNFSAMINLSKFYEFAKHYFSNDGFFGLLDNMYVLKCEKGKTDIDAICDEESFMKFFKNILEVHKVNYNNDLKAKNILEKKLFVNRRTTVDRVCREENLEKITLSEEDIENILNMIKYSYGESFYNLNTDLKIKIIVSAVKYRLDPKSIISGWIMHFYFYNTNIVRGIKVDDKFVSTFAMMPSLYILKSYLVLYRLQNKELANWDIDLDLINQIDFNYDINYYNDFKLKQINKGYILDEEQYKKKYFCEIFRDSLAHGNIKIDFQKDDCADIIQYITFSDIYKSRIREVSLSIEELDKFLSSVAFNGKDLTDKGKSYSLTI